jgi:anthraniloyl-CoA monooxygenase
VLDAVRAVWDGILAIRLSVTDWARAGVSVEDGVATARTLVEHGCDLIHVEAGQTVANDRPEYRRGFLTALSDRVRVGAGVPTLVGGHLTTLDDASTIVGAGRGDLCILDLPLSDLERELLPALDGAESAAVSS